MRARTIKLFQVLTWSTQCESVTIVKRCSRRTVDSVWIRAKAQQLSHTARRASSHRKVQQRAFGRRNEYCWQRTANQRVREHVAVVAQNAVDCHHSQDVGCVRLCVSNKAKVVNKTNLERRAQRSLPQRRHAIVAVRARASCSVRPTVRNHTHVHNKGHF